MNKDEEFVENLKQVYIESAEEDEKLAEELMGVSNEALKIELEKEKNMYGMFVYYDKKLYNNTTIKGSLKDLCKQIEIISEDLLKKEKKAIIEIKLWNIIIKEDTTKD